MVKHCSRQHYLNLQLIPRANPVGFFARFLDFSDYRWKTHLKAPLTRQEGKEFSQE